MSGFITNAELRIEAERLDGENAALRGRIAELEALARDMHSKMDCMARLADGWMDTISFTAEWEAFGERMRELGIEMRET